jgi:hypothetical protein
MFKQQLSPALPAATSLNDSLQNDLISQYLASQLSSLQTLTNGTGGDMTSSSSNTNVNNSNGLHLIHNDQNENDLFLGTNGGGLGHGYLPKM